MPLTGSAIHHLDAARGWLDLGSYAECWDELEKVDFNNRGTEEEAHILWHLYQRTKQYVPAANYALGIQRRWPNKLAGYVWRSVSLEKLGCFQDTYDNLERVADDLERGRIAQENGALSRT